MKNQKILTAILSLVVAGLLFIAGPASAAAPVFFVFSPTGEILIDGADTLALLDVGEKIPFAGLVLKEGDARYLNNTLLLDTCVATDVESAQKFLAPDDGVTKILGVLGRSNFEAHKIVFCKHGKDGARWGDYLSLSGNKAEFQKTGLLGKDYFYFLEPNGDLSLFFN